LPVVAPGGTAHGWSQVTPVEADPPAPAEPKTLHKTDAEAARKELGMD
jgi:hypothetical protein